MNKYTDYNEEYAQCYELITQHKHYAEEVESLSEVIGKFNSDKKILSVGCGTGIHERYLAKLGFKVFGIDKSEWMINCAVMNSPDLPNLSFGRTFDEARSYLGSPFTCVISLFNVINCLPDLRSLREFFEEIDHSIRKFQMKTGADNLYITMLLGALINDYRVKAPEWEDFK